uniref:TIR domain-containing protein n=1 Tax=Brassica campestris TaxID=3711 RepID=M4DHQ0_BRACM
MNRILKKLSCFKTKVKSLRLFESNSSLSSSSSSSFTPQKYNVFLNFRGADTRKNFVSFLYRDLVAKEIRTFKDDKELERGQLVKILKLEKQGLIKVLPIFYDVDPCDVRRQTGAVKKHFEKHKKRLSREKVKSWRDALNYLAELSGECSQNWEDDSKLVVEITERITERVSKMLFSVKPRNGNNLIGIDEHMNELYPRLDLSSKEGVRVIGIWGRGSMGRSALARHVYESISHNFEAHCFLEDVRKISQHCRKSHLQEELLSMMQGEGLNTKSSHRCLKAIRARLRNKKVLLVANDVDKIEQLESLGEEFSWFGHGSRVVITTQDRQLLSSWGVKIVYEVEFLKCCEVRKLFRSEAFKQREVDPVGLEQSTYHPHMNFLGINFILKCLVALLCDTGQLKERLSALIYTR